MSWNCYLHRVCVKCGKSFKQNMGTLAMKRSDFQKCPYCGGDSEPDEAQNAKERRKSDERFEKYRRIAEQ